MYTLYNIYIYVPRYSNWSRSGSLNDGPHCISGRGKRTYTYNRWIQRSQSNYTQQVHKASRSLFERSTSTNVSKTRQLSSLASSALSLVIATSSLLSFSSFSSLSSSFSWSSSAISSSSSFSSFSSSSSSFSSYVSQYSLSCSSSSSVFFLFDYITDHILHLGASTTHDIVSGPRLCLKLLVQCLHSLQRMPLTQLRICFDFPACAPPHLPHISHEPSSLLSATDHWPRRWKISRDPQLSIPKLPDDARRHRSLSALRHPMLGRGSPFHLLFRTVLQTSISRASCEMEHDRVKPGSWRDDWRRSSNWILKSTFSWHITWSFSRVQKHKRHTSLVRLSISDSSDLIHSYQCTYYIIYTYIFQDILIEHGPEASMMDHIVFQDEAKEHTHIIAEYNGVNQITLNKCTKQVVHCLKDRQVLMYPRHVNCPHLLPPRFRLSSPLHLCCRSHRSRPRSRGSVPSDLRCRPYRLSGPAHCPDRSRPSAQRYCWCAGSRQLEEAGILERVLKLSQWFSVLAVAVYPIWPATARSKRLARDIWWGIVGGMSDKLKECVIADDNDNHLEHEHNGRDTNGVRICMCFAARVRTWVPWHARDVPCCHCAWSRDEQERQATHVCDTWQGQCCCVLSLLLCRFGCSTSQELHISATQNTLIFCAPDQHPLTRDKEAHACPCSCSCSCSWLYTIMFVPMLMIVYDNARAAASADTEHTNLGFTASRSARRKRSRSTVMFATLHVGVELWDTRLRDIVGRLGAD